MVYLLNGGLARRQIGPIPKGTPVSLLANINPDARPEDLKHVIGVVRDTFTEIESTRSASARATSDEICQRSRAGAACRSASVRTS